MGRVLASSWDLLGALGALLGVLGASWERLSSVLGPLGQAYEKTYKNLVFFLGFLVPRKTCSTYEREALRKEDKQQACEPNEWHYNEEHHASILKTDEAQSPC